jgi:hypothetical protein
MRAARWRLRHNTVRFHLRKTWIRDEPGHDEKAYRFQGVRKVRKCWLHFRSDPEVVTHIACLHSSIEPLECRTIFASDRRLFHCFDEVQRPMHPSDRLNVPEPLRPETWPELTTVTPL